MRAKIEIPSIHRISEKVAIYDIPEYLLTKSKLNMRANTLFPILSISEKMAIYKIKIKKTGTYPQIVSKHESEDSDALIVVTTCHGPADVAWHCKRENNNLINTVQIDWSPTINLERHRLEIRNVAK